MTHASPDIRCGVAQAGLNVAQTSCPPIQLRDCLRGDAMHSKNETFDVVVVGSGPAGSTVAALVAVQGHRVLLLERERLPVYKIGESLLPSTIHGVCGVLGVTEELKAANFIKKFGGTFRWGQNKEPWTFTFASSTRFPGSTAYAYQVERMKFDTILLDNARRKGVQVRAQHRVSDVLIDGDRVAGVQVTTDRGTRLDIAARYVVDASGHSSTIARYAGERVYSKVFRNLAVFGYFLNGRRFPPPNSGNIFSVAFDKGWFWYIPLTDTLTSVGAVIGQEHAAILQQGKEVAFSQLVNDCEPIRNMLMKATRPSEGVYSEVRVRKDFSYCHTAFWRPGLVLVGDAACFIDPLFSSGVHLATYSGLLAARSINTYLSNQMSESQAFTEFGKRYLREYTIFHNFLVSFYDLDQDLDGYYWAARKVLNVAETGSEAFVRLVGGMGGSGETLQATDGFVVSFSGLAKQLFPAAEGDGRPDTRTGASTTTAGVSEDLIRDQFWKTLTAEWVQMRMQARNLKSEAKPLFEDGLVPSTDGLHWQVPIHVT